MRLERRFLQDWVRKVCRKLQDQDRLVRQNAVLVATQKEQRQVIRQVQDDLVHLQSQIRKVKYDIKVQQEEVRLRQQEQATFASACRFLCALDEPDKDDGFGNLDQNGDNHDE